MFCPCLWIFHCSDNVVRFVSVYDFSIAQTVWYVLSLSMNFPLLRHCGTFCLIFPLLRQCGTFCLWCFHCSDSVVRFVSVYDFSIAQTVWYVLSLIFPLLGQCGTFCLIFHCSDCVVRLVSVYDFSIAQTVWYVLSLSMNFPLLRQCGTFCFSFYELEIFQNNFKLKIFY
jgi:hypothetical protein